jgi:hypothetical protein
VSVTHLLDLRDKLQEAHYLAALFIVLIVGSNVLALWFGFGRRLDLAWPLAFLCGALPVVGYVISRSVGLPQIEDHVGHWADPFGTASLVFELALAALCLPRLRGAALRAAPSAIFLASGLVAGGLMLGEASNSHVGHHEHGGLAHDHAGHHHAGSGHDHAGHAHHIGMNVYTATPGQRAQAQRLLDATRTSASGFASYAAARAAGYGFAMKPFVAQRQLDYWHLTNPAFLTDGRNLDPKRPESLMYWHRPKGPPVLVAVVYRVPSVEPNPTLGGPVLQWHLHRNARGGFGRYKMTHIWLLPRLVDAFSMELPAAALARTYHTPLNGTGAGL